MNLKTKLFDFRKSLSNSDIEVFDIVTAHYDNYEKMSEKMLVNSLNERLSNYTFYSNVKNLLKETNNYIQTDSLLFDLKDLYKKLENNNRENLYNAPLQLILEIINTSDSSIRMNKIVNELSIYDWIGDVKGLMYNLASTPQEKQKYTNSGRCDKVYSVALNINEGILTYINGKWFLLNENAIEITKLDNHIKTEKELKSYKLLETALQTSIIDDAKLSFRLTEDLTIGVSTADKTKGRLFLNNEPVEKTTTLETIFQSALVSKAQSPYYYIINECLNNLDKFVEIDIASKIYSTVNPVLECYAFNYGNNIYLYRNDKNQGDNLFKYESAVALINDVKKELDYDLTRFYENKVSKTLNNIAILEKNKITLIKKVNKFEKLLELLNNEKSTLENNIPLIKLTEKINNKYNKYIKQLQETKNKLNTYYNN